MGNLEVRIRHGGGVFGPPMVYAVIALVVVIVFGVGAAALSAALMTLFIWVGAAIGLGVFLGLLVWFLTRGYRAKREKAFMDYRAEREEAYHRRDLERVRARAQIKAQEHAAMAAMIAAAVQQQRPAYPHIAYAPPTVRAEVLKPEDKSG